MGTLLKRNARRGRRVSMRTIHALSQQIAQQFQPDKIVLFGSYAYGRPTPESDADLLVLIDTPLRNREQAAQIARALDYHFGLDLIVRTPQQFNYRIAEGDFFLREIAEKGKVLYARADS
jgi:predicted nucleotidyltransferase